MPCERADFPFRKILRLALWSRTRRRSERCRGGDRGEPASEECRAARRHELVTKAAAPGHRCHLSPHANHRTTPSSFVLCPSSVYELGSRPGSIDLRRELTPACGLLRFPEVFSTGCSNHAAGYASAFPVERVPHSYDRRPDSLLRGRQASRFRLSCTRLYIVLYRKVCAGPPSFMRPRLTFFSTLILRNDPHEAKSNGLVSRL